MDKCPFCRNPMTAYETCSFLYHECTICFFRFLDPSFHVSDGESLERYRLHDNTAGNSGYGTWIKGVMDFGVFPFIGDKGSFLDYGCGTGQSVRKYLNDFSSDSWQYYGYDKFFFPEKPSVMYQFLFCCEVAEHFIDPEGDFQEMLRYLEPGGILTLSTLFAPPYRQDFKKWWYRQDCTHTSFFTQATLAVMTDRFNLARIADNGRNIIVYRKGK